MTARIKIISLVLALEVILLLTMGVLYFQQYQARDMELLDHVASSLENNLIRETVEINQRYTHRVAGFTRSNPRIVQAFIDQDRDSLIARVQKKVETLHREDSYFLSISFVLKDGTVFYRSSNPNNAGDNVAEVPFVADSVSVQQPLGGLVLSRGGLAHRFSYPVFDNDVYLGMIVFVVKATRAIESVAQNSGVECGIFIQNNLVDLLDRQERWSNGQKTLVAATSPLFQDRSFLNVLPLFEQAADFSFNQRSYKKFRSLKIKNYRQSVVGEIVTVLNVTHHRSEFIQSLIRTGVICGGVLFLTGGVLYFGIGRFLQQVNELHSRLETKVALRTKELQVVNERLALEVEERKHAQAELQHLSEIDVLTGLANRRKFDAYYDTEWNAAKRDQRMISLLMIDIDCFKPYNDKYGHLAGDEALTQIAETLQKYVSRPRDLVARYGGEEFICLLPETSLDAAITVAEKLRAKIEQLDIIHEFSLSSVRMTISIGIANVIPEECHSKEDVIDLADKALYRAKKAGRNCVKANAV